MNTLDTIAAAYRSHQASNIIHEPKAWDALDERTREGYRTDIRLIGGLLADAMERVGFCKVYDARSAIAFLREIAAEDGCPKS